MRTDQPSAAEHLADRLALSERTGDRDELRQRLARLPPGHPSSPVEADGTPRLPERGLGAGREAADAADRRPLTDAEHAEHVTQVKERLDKARADGLATGPATSPIPTARPGHLSGERSWPAACQERARPRSWSSTRASTARSSW